MNLGDVLRETLDREAAAQTSTAPDVEVLIHGGLVRRRRRNRTRTGAVAAATAMLAGGLIVGLDQLEPGAPGDGPTFASQPPEQSDRPLPTPPALPSNSGSGNLEAGTYRVLVGAGTTGAAIEADLTLGKGWNAANFPVLEERGDYGGFGVYRTYVLAAGSGCSNGATNADLGETPQALAGQLAKLPDSTLLMPPTSTQMFGHEAMHLRVRITTTCPAGQWYRVAETPRGSRGVTYGDTPAAVTIDFWVLDLGGVPVVVDSWHQEDATKSLVDRIDQARDSIAFAADS